MTDNQNLNPFENAIEGGGLWDMKKVTILSSKITVHQFQNKADETVVQNVWEITGMSDDSDRERVERYSIGSYIPTNDGESFVQADGSPATGIRKSTKAYRFYKAMKDGGFDPSRFVVDDRFKASALVGAVFTFKAVQRLDRDGNPKTNKDGYPENDFYPVTFHGFKEGVGAAGPASVSDDVKDEAIAVANRLLKAAGGVLARRDFSRMLSTELAGNANLPIILKSFADGSLFEGTNIKADGTNVVST